MRSWAGLQASSRTFCTSQVTDHRVGRREEGNLWGDKAYSTVFDNAKLRNLVPDFKATVPFSAGIQETVAWFDADPGRQEIDAAANERWDRLARVYGEALLRAAGR